MKKLIPILLSVFIAFSYGAKKEIEKYPNGNKKSVVKLNKEGQKHGEYKSYFDNKKLQSKGEYQFDKKNGAKKNLSLNKMIFLNILVQGNIQQ